MRMFELLAAIAGAVTLTGCSEMVSLNAPVTDSAAGVDDRLEGIWEAGKDMCIIRKPVDGVYRIVYSEAPQPENPASADARQFEGRLLITPNAEILDLASPGADGFQIPAHMWARIWPGQRELRWAWLD